MQQLLAILQDLVVRDLIERLSRDMQWTAPIAKSRNVLRHAMNTSSATLSMFNTLTSLYWPKFTPSPWQTQQDLDKKILAFHYRLQEIASLLTANAQMQKLLSDGESNAEENDRLNKAFKILESCGHNCWVINVYTTEIWKSALLAYDNAIGSYIPLVASKLSRLLSSAGNNASLLLKEFGQYSELLKRKDVCRMLQSERETLLVHLTTLVGSVRSELHSRSLDSITQIVDDLQWTVSSFFRIREVSNVVNAFLGDLPAAPNFIQISQSVSADLERRKVQNFNDWVADVEVTVKEPNSPLTLQRTGKLMSVALTDGRMQVNYSDGLVQLVKDVRRLLALGFSIPASIQKVVDHAREFYRHGIVLKQVAHFHNAIDAEILPSQQIMLLEAAKNFENIVKDPKNNGGGNMTWDEPSQVEKFIQRLQSSVDQLNGLNHRLRQLHGVIEQHVLTLASTDLFKDQDKWKTVMQKIRQILADVETGGIPAENMIGWKTHWDAQLYKVLMCQYRAGLSNMHQQLPPQVVELTVTNSEVSFKPPLEEIQARYNKDLKKLVCLPMAFKGLVPDSKIFSKIIDTCTNDLAVVYNASTKIFEELQASVIPFQPWQCLFAVDVESLVKQHMKTTDDFTVSFKSIKSKLKEAESLPSSFQVQTIRVNTSALKLKLEEGLQSINEYLYAALSSSVMDDVQLVETFLQTAQETFSTVPNTLEEVNTVQEKFVNLKSFEMVHSQHFADAESKNRLLRSMGSNGVDLNLVSQGWQSFTQQIGQYESVIQQQVTLLRGSIDTKANAVIKTMQELLTLETYSQETVSIIQNLQTQAESITSMCVHFGLTTPDFSGLDELLARVNDLVQSQEKISQFHSAMDTYLKGEFTEVITYRLSALSSAMELWMSARQPSIASITSSYLARSPIFTKIKSEHWKTHHWIDFFKRHELPVQGCTLTQILQATLDLSVVADINFRAQGESSIEEALNELEVWAATAVFATTSYLDCKGNTFQIIKGWKEVIGDLGDRRSLLSSLKDSPFYKNFEERCVVWDTKLSKVDVLLNSICTTQRKWVYLEPILGRGALPSEQARFDQVDQKFKDILALVADDQHIVSIVVVDPEGVDGLNESLDRSQKALSEYLERKRSVFARFYFLGDEDLLEILGQSDKPEIVQNHLKKLFMGIHTVIFNDDLNKITGIISAEGEEIKLSSSVKIGQNVEEWLNALNEEMQRTLKELLAKCLKESNLFNYPQQILDLAQSINFSERCESAIAHHQLKEYKKELQQQLQQYTSFKAPANNKHILQLRVKSLIFDLIRYIAIVDVLIEDNANDANHWTWQRQLRCYVKDKGVRVHMADADFDYSFEYQGNPIKLVHTKLTDKCYLTLTQAMANGYGGNPFGPAGTGKTESVKALGYLFGRQVLVFNCDEGIDYRAMARIFTGLVKCGSWGCFDEFNRLEEAVLSTVSQQIQTIQNGLSQNAKTIMLINQEMELDPNAAVFVTLNPAGKNYGGRNKLPDNLKQLFRSVAMSLPDNDLIAEVILLSEGYTNASILGAKAVSVFTLSKQLLSDQQHYDWGLRPLRSVLRMAGQLFSNHSDKSDTGQQDCLVKALRVSTLSKLTIDDAYLFDGVLKDTFEKPHFRSTFFSRL